MFARLRPMRMRNLLGLFAASALLVPGSAVAADKGVHVDPGSPAGKEYAVPLDQGRHQGAGAPGAPGGGGPGGPAAGGGAGHGGHGAGGAQGAAGSSGKAHHGAGGSAGGTKTAGSPAASSSLFGQGITPNGSGHPSNAAALQAAEKGRGGSGLAWTVGIAAAVLLLGGGLAVGVPRLTRWREQAA